VPWVGGNKQIGVKSPVILKGGGGRTKKNRKSWIKMASLFLCPSSSCKNLPLTWEVNLLGNLEKHIPWASPLSVESITAERQCPGEKAK
jgi:hypothetical protein